MNAGVINSLHEFLRMSIGKSSLRLLLFPSAGALILTAILRLSIPTNIYHWSSAKLSWLLTTLLHVPPLVWCCLSILFLLHVFHQLHWKRRRLPPGPVPWLLAGNMPQVIFHGATNIDALLQRWRAHYGGIFTFWMGPIPMVMVCEVELLRRYFVRNGDVFSGRWQNFITHTFMDGHNGVIQIQGEKWREQRRFSLHVLRDFGLGRSLMEQKIGLEVRALVDHLHSLPQCSDVDSKAVPVDICKPIAVCIANIINNILFGRTYPHDDPAFIRVQQMLDRQSSLVVQPVMGLYLSVPWSTRMPLLDFAWRELLSIRNDFWAFLDGHIREHLANFRPEAEATDFTFAYLLEMERRRGGGEEGHFSEKQLKMLLLDLFFAGSETTVTTTKWGILLLILHPAVQERCLQEMHAKIGGREPELRDRAQLVFLNATICEIQRLANILPINLLRTCLETVEVDGFRFPAGTMVLPQISITLNDPVYFAEPQQFRPERFLDESGSSLRRIDAFLPFSIGKRQCLGESLARAELFLIFAHLIRQFQFLPESVHKMPSRKRVYGLTVAPQPFKCRLVRRAQHHGDRATA